MKKKKLHRVSMQLLLLSEAESPRPVRFPAWSRSDERSTPEPSMAVSAALPEAHSEKANVVAIDSSSKSPCGLSGVAEVFLPRPTPDRCLDRSFGGLAFPGDRRLPSPTRYSSAPRLYLRMRPAFEPVFFGRDGCLETFPPQGALCFRVPRFASPVAFNLHEFFGGVVLLQPVYPTFLAAPTELMMFGNEAKPYCLNDSSELYTDGRFLKRGRRARGDPRVSKRRRLERKTEKTARGLDFPTLSSYDARQAYPAQLCLLREDGTSATSGVFFCPLFGFFGLFQEHLPTRRTKAVKSPQKAKPPHRSS